MDTKDNGFVSRVVFELTDISKKSSIFFKPQNIKQNSDFSLFRSFLLVQNIFGMKMEQLDCLFQKPLTAIW